MSLNNFGIVRRYEGKTLSRSAQPDKNGRDTLLAMDVKLILKLNTSSEYPLSAEEGMIPVREISLNAFNPDESTVRNLVEMIQSNFYSDSVHVHCSHGRDRTGLVIGAWQILYGGMSLSAVMDDRKNYGTNWAMDIPDHNIIEMLKKFANEKGVA